MTEKLNFTDVISAVQKKLNEHLKKYSPDLKCYDVPPKNVPIPFVYAEYSELLPAASKTMNLDEHTVLIHIVCDGTNSNKQLFDLVHVVAEALTEEIELNNKNFFLVSQTAQGTQSLGRDYESADNDVHAVLSYSFLISSGYKIKV